MTCLNLVIGRGKIQNQAHLTLTSTLFTVHPSIHPSLQPVSQQSVCPIFITILKLRCIWKAAV